MDIFEAIKEIDKGIENAINQVVDAIRKNKNPESVIFIERATPLNETGGLLPVIISEWPGKSCVDDFFDWGEYELFQKASSRFAHYLKGRCMIYEPTTIILSKGLNDDLAYNMDKCILSIICNDDINKRMKTKV